MPRISAPNLSEHRERTLTALLDAVDELAVERGLDEVSLRDITARAGVARTAVYNYVPDKAALLLAAADRATSDVRARMAQIARQPQLSARERFNRMVQALLTDFTQSTQQLFMARLLHSTLSSTQRELSMAPFRKDIHRQLADVIREGQADGSLTGGHDPDITADLITGVLETSVTSCLERPERATIIGKQTLVFLQRAMHSAV